MPGTSTRTCTKAAKTRTNFECPFKARGHDSYVQYFQKNTHYYIRKIARNTAQHMHAYLIIIHLFYSALNHSPLSCIMISGAEVSLQRTDTLYPYYTCTGVLK
jgi:hypothetical protein